MTEKEIIRRTPPAEEAQAFDGQKQAPRRFIKSLWKGTPFLFGALTVAALFIGFRLRQYEYFTAEEGVGYALGIIGGGMMLALLLYPLRKRFRILRLIGNVKVWFGLHMIFGVLGPLLILFHANFGLGSTNSNVALFSMLIVSVSGVIGRYIYTKIHHGLYGQKIELGQLKEALHHNQEELAALLRLNPEARTELFTFADHALSPSKGLLHSWARVMSVGLRSRFLIRNIKRDARRELKQNLGAGALSRKEIRAKMRLIAREADIFLHRGRKVVEFNFYERMFALWHVLHLPLFFMMLAAAIVHVIAVHLY